jgi:hypothetical protein
MRLWSALTISDALLTGRRTVKRGMTPRNRITQDPASWQAGCKAAMGDGSPDDASECPPEVPDALAYASGFVEGRAARRRAASARAKALRTSDR